MHYARRMNIPIQHCPICNAEVTIERYPRAGVRTFWADTGEYHGCTLPELRPLNDRDFRYAARPAQKEN